VLNQRKYCHRTPALRSTSTTAGAAAGPVPNTSARRP
jgi:hypothetical protein